MAFLLSTPLTLQTTFKLQSFQSVMLKPVYLLTIQDTHKEYNSLMDQIWAKYEQLYSGESGAVCTPAFNAEACELANLLAHVSQLCQRLNLPTPKEYRILFDMNFHLIQRKSLLTNHFELTHVLQALKMPFRSIFIEAGCLGKGLEDAALFVDL